MKAKRLFEIVLLTGVAVAGLTSGVYAARSQTHPALQTQAQVSTHRVAASVMTLMPEHINMVVVPDSLAGSDKRHHDAIIPAYISAQVGQKIIITFYNIDTAPHSFTAQGLGLNVIIPPAPKDGVPSITTFSFTVNKVGTFHWKCILPCDNGGVNAWAMIHDGYMAGTIVIQRA